MLLLFFLFSDGRGWALPGQKRKPTDRIEALAVLQRPRIFNRIPFTRLCGPTLSISTKCSSLLLWFTITCQTQSSAPSTRYCMCEKIVKYENRKRERLFYWQTGQSGHFRFPFLDFCFFIFYFASSVSGKCPIFFFVFVSDMCPFHFGMGICVTCCVLARCMHFLFLF